MENEKTRERDNKRELHELPYTQMVKSRTILLTSGKLPKFLNYTYSMCIIGEVAVFGYYLPTVLKTKDTLITSTDSVLSSPPPFSSVLQMQCIQFWHIFLEMCRCSRLRVLHFASLQRRRILSQNAYLLHKNSYRIVNIRMHTSRECNLNRNAYRTAKKCLQ